MTAPIISVVLVYFDDRVNLTACLDAVFSTPPETSVEAILVDNASTDGGAEDASAAFPSLRVLRNENNPGFGSACNRGARESAGEFLLFLNTDTILQPGALETLLSALRADSGAAAAGPLLYPSEGKAQVSFGNRVDFFGQFGQKLFLNPFYSRSGARKRKLRTVGWLSAACLLCRRDAFEKAGGFDERFFLYFEDIDLCARMRKNGGRLLYVPSARVFHEGGATTGVRPAQSRLEYRKSQILFYSKHASRGSLRLLRVYLSAGLTLKRLLGRFRGEQGRALLEAYRGLLKSRGGPG